MHIEIGTIIVIHSKPFLSSSPSCAPSSSPRYPNDFWGWGGEDDALKHRLDDSGIEFR